MRKRRWLLLGLLIAGSGCAVAVALVLLPPGPEVTPENYGRVQNGMTRAEVEAIFGAPPTAVPSDNEAMWESGDGYRIAAVEFDEDGRVAGSNWVSYTDDRTAFQKALDILPWRHKDTKPSHLTPYRIHGGVGPASSSI